MSLNSEELDAVLETAGARTFQVMHELRMSPGKMVSLLILYQASQLFEVELPPPDVGIY